MFYEAVTNTNMGVHTGDAIGRCYWGRMTVKFQIAFASCADPASRVSLKTSFRASSETSLNQSRTSVPPCIGVFHC